MSHADFGYRLGILRFFVPFGLVVYIYQFVSSFQDDLFWFTIVSALVIADLAVSGVLTLRIGDRPVTRHVLRHYAVYVRVPLFLIGISQILAVAVYARMAYLPWVYVFPFLTVALLETRRARWWVLVHAILLFPRVFGFWPGQHAQVDTFAGLTALVAYTALFVLSAIIESARKKSLGAVLEQKRRLGVSLDQLEEARHLAETASQAKSDFLANMSHELRTPLNHIIGFTELVANEKFGTLNPLQKEHLGDALGSSGHLLSLINDILDLSKVEAGRMELQIAPVNTRRLLEESVTMLSDAAAVEHASASVEVSDSVTTISADHRKLSQVMYNLLSNAVKHAPGGKITVVATGGGDRDPWCEIRVSDTGEGIDEGMLERIFQPFEQGSSTTGRRPRGTGLGLSVARDLVELHGGRLWAESEGPGKGSAFVIRIPVTGPELNGAMATSPSA